VNGERILERFEAGAPPEKENAAAAPAPANTKRKQAPPVAGPSSRAGSAPPSSGYMPTRSSSVVPATRPVEGSVPKRQRTVEPATVARPTRAAAAKPPASVTRSTTKASGAPRSTAKAKAPRSVLATTQTRIGGPGLKTPAPTGLPTRKPRRESFKPRPSMEAAVFAPAIDVRGAPRWPGIKEEDA
jgi:hypothetical protein